MPIYNEEARAVLDVLWNVGILRWEWEVTARQRQWPHTLASKAAQSFGKYPPRPNMARAKKEFEESLIEAVREGLEQAAKVRECMERAAEARGISLEDVQDEEELEAFLQGDDDQAYREVEEAAEQILHDIYPVNAYAVALGSGKFGVEIFINRYQPHLIDGFKDHQEADQWIREHADAYAAQNGAPAGTKVVKVGEKY